MCVCVICTSTTTCKKTRTTAKIQTLIEFCGMNAIKWRWCYTAKEHKSQAHTATRKRKTIRTNTCTPSHNWDSSRAVAATHMQWCPIKIEFFCNFHSYVCALYTNKYTTNDILWTLTQYGWLFALVSILSLRIVVITFFTSPHMHTFAAAMFRSHIQHSNIYMHTLHTRTDIMCMYMRIV